MRKFKMPKWMEPYRELIGNTGGNSVEELMDSTVSAQINLPLAVLAVAVKSQVGLLHTLHERGFLAKVHKPAPDVKRTTFA